MRQASKLIGFGVLCSPAFAGAVPLIGDVANSAGQTGATFEATASYAVVNAGQGELTLSITNMSSTSVGGFLTGVGFYLGSQDANATVSLTSASDADFAFDQNFNAPSFGNYDFGAAIGGNFTGGGNPSAGLGMADAATFVFSISASDASLLDIADFVGDGSGIVTRFRGLDFGDSDTVRGIVPSPASVSVIGLAGLVAARRRR